MRIRSNAQRIASLACIACIQCSTGGAEPVFTNRPQGAPSTSTSGTGQGGDGATTSGDDTSVPDRGGPNAGDASRVAPNDDAGGSGATSGCGGRSGMRGKTVRSLMVSGKMRSYVAYLPEAANPTHGLPFVYVFHGANQTGANLYDMTEYSTLADSEGIAVVFPDGQGASSIASMGVLAPWNVSDNGASVCGAGALANNPTSSVDFAFMDAIKADIEQDQCLDKDHVFATGFSMGGYFTHHVTCDRPDIRAGAPHSGGTEATLDGVREQDTSRSSSSTARPIRSSRTAATIRTGAHKAAFRPPQRSGRKRTAASRHTARSPPTGRAGTASATCTMAAPRTGKSNSAPSRTLPTRGPGRPRARRASARAPATRARPS